MVVAARNNDREKIISLIEKAIPSYNKIPKEQEEFNNVKNQEIHETKHKTKGTDRSS